METTTNRPSGRVKVQANDEGGCGCQDAFCIDCQVTGLLSRVQVAPPTD